MSRQVVQGPALMVGAPSNAEYGVHIGGSYGQPLQVDATSTDANQWGPVQVQSPFAWSSGGSGGEIYATVVTSAQAFSYSFMAAYYAGPPSIGAGSTVSSLIGFYARNQGAAGVSNAYGVYISSQSGASSTNLSLYCQGTSQFMSMVGIGIPPSGTSQIMLYVGGAGMAGATQSTVFIRPSFSSAGVTSVQALGIQSFGNSAAYTTAAAYGIQVQAPFLFTNSFVTTLYAIYVSNQGATGVTNAYGLYLEAQSGASGTNLAFYNAGQSTLAGNVGIGVGPQALAWLTLGGSLGSGNNQQALYIAPTFTSAATSYAIGLNVGAGLAAASFTVSEYDGLRVSAPGLGSGSAITNAFGVRVTNQGAAGIANAYGVYIDPQSGASGTNMGLYNGGTTTLIGTLFASDIRLSYNVIAAGGTIPGWSSFNIVNASGSTVYLPAGGGRAGSFIVVKNWAGANVTLTATGGQVIGWIDGSAPTSIVLS